MTRMRLAAALLAVSLLVAAAALSSCGTSDRAKEPVTSSAQPSDRPSILPVDAPDPNLVQNPAAAAARGSVVKVRGVANSCKKILEGTGFVFAPNQVMSNAHAVAGTDSVTVEVDGNSFDAHVVSYDPGADLSVLHVPNLTARPLAFAPSSVQSGADALVLGYPGGGPLVITPARVREGIELQGPDIYHTTTVYRQVYTIRGAVQQGDSGGPLIDVDGRVLGMVFGAAPSDPDTGFVLTADALAQQRAKVTDTQPVVTGACIS